MTASIIFKDLPATFPEKDRFRNRSVVSSLVFHVILIGTLLLVPFFLTRGISENELLVFLVAPLGPPPAPLPPPAAVVEARPAAPAIKPATKVAPDAIIMPTVIPKDIARIVEDAPVTVGVVGGVPGGLPGGVAGGVLGSILSSNAREPAPLPAPIPPPPVLRPARPEPVVTSPVRVGGLVREPRVVKAVPPVYPRIASQARISGNVILEAILTAEGKVEELRVISGHPLLLQAAMDAVKQWEYEPTLLNGVPVPVILTAVVRFNQRPTS